MSTKQWHERRKPTPENPVRCFVTDQNAISDEKYHPVRNIIDCDDGRFVDSDCLAWKCAEPVTPIDQYTYWHGGECPVAGDTVVDVIYRGGRLDTNSRQQAKFRNWNHSLEEFDIIAYRIHVED